MMLQVVSTLYWGVDNQTKFNFIQQFHTSPYFWQIEQDIIDKHIEPHLTLIKNGIEQSI